ncbi:MAG TPA: hypothetical protein VJZ26_00225 [Blastocatellia bacterium]|nr:hypothetical protein [Blastocatellia bacterium]
MEVSELTPELAKQIIEAAAARGIPVEAFLQTVIKSSVAKTEEKKQGLTPQDKVKLWQEWVDSHSYIKAPPLSDYAVSRESIYTREDEMS